MAFEAHNDRKNTCCFRNGFEQSVVKCNAKNFSSCTVTAEFDNGTCLDKDSTFNARSKKIKSKVKKALCKDPNESIAQMKCNKQPKKKPDRKKLSRSKNIIDNQDKEPTHSDNVSVDKKQDSSADNFFTNQKLIFQEELDSKNQGVNSMKTDMQTSNMEIDDKSGFQKFNQELSCICINSTIRTFPKDSISVSISFDSEGICLQLPRFKKSSKTVPVLLSESNVENVLVYCDRYLCSYISIVTSSNLGESLKENLKIYKGSSPYFNPDAEIAKQLKISFLLQNVTEDITAFLYSIYDKKKITKINQNDAVEMLKSTSPKVSSNFPQLLISDILVYPPVGGVEVKSKDIACLVNGKSLNDTIIEFYLKYIYYEKIPSEMQERTHIFNPFFYSGLERIFGSHISSKIGVETIDSVKQWTKNVDLFSKDFIFVPINKKKHWYLVVLCYLTEVFKEFEEIELDCDSPEAKSNESSKLPSVPHDARKTRKQNDITICEKRPCICIFDSLDGGSRMSHEKLKVANILEKYLELLWKSKNPDVLCDWKKLLFLKASCPQQKNTFDCGIYLLQYVESFLEKPISSNGESLPNLKNWFREDVIKRKRAEIKNVISELKGQQSETLISPSTSNNFDVIDLT